MNELKCPYCAAGVEYAPASRVYRREGFGFLYLCKGFPACDSYVAAGDDARPAGSLANKHLRDLRKQLYELVSKASNDYGIPRQEVSMLIAKSKGKKQFRITDLREAEIEIIFSDIEGFMSLIKDGLLPSLDAETQALKLPLRYLFIGSHKSPASALPYSQYRGHLKVLNESVKSGLVSKITKQGTRKIFFVLTKAGKNLIDYDSRPAFSSVRY